jgi:hypothetical protein
MNVVGYENILNLIEQNVHWHSTLMMYVISFSRDVWISNEWLSSSTSTTKLTFYHFFSSVMYVHHLMSIFHPYAMPHIIASSSFVRAYVRGRHTHTHVQIECLFVYILWWSHFLFFLFLLFICICTLTEWVPNGKLNWSIKKKEKRNRKKNDGIIEIDKKTLPLLLFDDYEIDQRNEKI